MTIQLVIAALFFLAIGAVGLLSPRRIFALFGVPAETADSRNEIRAVYGGMCLALAATLIGAPALGSMADGVIFAVMILLLGMVAGRLISLAMERAGPISIISLGLELLGAGLLFSLIQGTIFAGA